MVRATPLRKSRREIEGMREPNRRADGPQFADTLALIEIRNHACAIVGPGAYKGACALPIRPPTRPALARLRGAARCGWRSAPVRPRGAGCGSGCARAPPRGAREGGT